MKTIEERVLGLERSAKRWRLVAVLAIGALAATGMLGGMEPDAGVVKARRFILVDEDGKERGVWQVKAGEPLLSLSGGGERELQFSPTLLSWQSYDGKEHLNLSPGLGLMLWGSRGTAQLSPTSFDMTPADAEIPSVRVLACNASGYPAITLFDPKSVDRRPFDELRKQMDKDKPLTGERAGGLSNDIAKAQETAMPGAVRVVLGMDDNGGRIGVSNKTREVIASVAADRYGNGEVWALDRKGQGNKLSGEK